MALKLKSTRNRFFNKMVQGLRYFKIDSKKSDYFYIRNNLESKIWN